LWLGVSSFSRTVIASYALSQAFEHRIVLELCTLHGAYMSRVVFLIAAQSKNEAGAAISSLLLLLMPWQSAPPCGEGGLSVFFSILLGGPVFTSRVQTFGFLI
jgi:hypothetical protein